MPNDHTPTELSNSDDSGRINRALHAELVASNPGGVRDGDDILDRLAAKLGPKLASGGNGGPKFLGLDRESWTKLVFAWVVAAALGVGAWYLAVRDALQVRPTTEQVREQVRGTFESHDDSSKAHPPIQVRLNNLSETQSVIRESQIRQEENAKTQTDTLRLIQVDISKMRRDRNR